MRLPKTPENVELARILHERLRAERRPLTWSTLGWRAAGIAGFIVMTGTGVALAGAGVAAALRARPDTEALARSLAQIVQHGHVVTVAGRVTASGEVGLSSAQTVGLAKDAGVTLANGARVRLVADDTPRPSDEQMKPDAKAPSGGKIATQFTVFKSTPYRKGEVVTGWNFRSSEDARPYHQYCYYLEQVETTSAVQFNLGQNQTFAAPRLPAGLDARQAYDNCVWSTG